LNWGHLLVAFMSVNALSLDTAIMRVQGEIRYKKLPESDRVPVKDRHEVAQKVFSRLFPLMRYTDLGIEADNDMEGFEEFIRFLELNKDRKMHGYYLIGVENEARVEKYTQQFYEMVEKYKDRIDNENHKITIAWIQRGEYGERITTKELDTTNRRLQEKVGAKEKIEAVLIKDPDIDLNVSSTYYRNSHDAAIVPYQVDEHAKRHGYYGHPPIDPRTGKNANLTSRSTSSKILSGSSVYFLVVNLARGSISSSKAFSSISSNVLCNA